MTDQDILSQARDRLATAMAAMNDTRVSELSDLKFFAGDEDNQFQWDAGALATRTGANTTIAARPTITVNKLPQHVRQVTNDQRQNRPAGKVIPADDKADIEVAEIYNGMVRHIEYMSDADVAYDTACENQVTYGEGYVRILTEYCNDQSFDQDIRIGRIRNSFSVYMDPMMQDPCGQDARWCFITEDMPKEDFEREFPKATPLSSFMVNGTGNNEIWWSDKTVRIAEYFYYENTRKTLNLYHGNVAALAGSPEDKQMIQMGMKPIKTRQVDVKQVKWLKINGYEVLESRDWAGKYIPVVRMVGNEFEIEGQLYISGIVRNAKGPQRLYNFWTSQEAEMLALAPKAPFIGYAGQFEGYETQWKTANTTAWPYLEVNPDVTDGAGGVLPLPQRALPPMAQTGLIQAKMGASDDIKGTTGQYDSSLGQTSNERSGKAILAREKQTDTGTYHFIDNYARTVRYVTRQIVDLIPKYYDTERIARIVGLDGEVSMAKINPNQPEPVKKIVDQNGIVMEKVYNPSVGTYDVMVTTGPSYMTKRQETQESMGQLLQGNPELWKVAGDLFVKEMDWPGAQDLAARLRKTIDPKLLEDGDKSPELQAAEQQMQQMSSELEGMHAMLRNVSQSFEAQDLQIKKFEAEVKAFDSETKRIAAVQSGMTPEQMSDIAMGTLHAAIASGHIMAGEMQEMSQPVQTPQPPPTQQPPAAPPPQQPPMAG